MNIFHLNGKKIVQARLWEMNNRSDVKDKGRSEADRMIPKCSVPSRPLQFQSLNGLRKLAETRRFKAFSLFSTPPPAGGRNGFHDSILFYSIHANE